MQFNKQQLEPDIGQQTGSILGKEYVKTVYYFYAEYIMWNASLDEAQAWIKVPGKISITSDMQMTPPLRQKVKRN